MEKWKIYMMINKSVFVFTFLTIIFASYEVLASEGNSTQIDSDATTEVVTEDFINVSMVPPSWFYLLYNWIGTFDIDPNNITNKDIDKYVTDTEKKEKIKKVSSFIKSFDTYPGEKRIIKWESMPIDISLTHEPEMDDAIRKTIKLIEENTNITFKIHEDRITENGITVDTYGLKKEHTDYCVHDYACTDLVVHGSTTYFKGDGSVLGLGMIGLNYFVNTLDINRKRIGNGIYFTPDTRFTDRFKHDYHVNGIIVAGDNHHLRGSFCDIFNNHKNKDISRSLATECVFRALGLTQFSSNNISLLSQRELQLENINWQLKPDKYDFLLLKILYDERLKTGMTLDEIKPFLTEIINDVVN